jgi:cation:H+ antiporter
MIAQILAFLAGIVLLYFGAEWLVRGASRLARSFGMSALVVGLTVVAIGTSAPELVVSVLAVLRGQTDMTVGNVVGSNISNIALILGASAIVYPIAIQGRLLSRGIPLGRCAPDSGVRGVRRPDPFQERRDLKFAVDAVPAH